jgi:predicted DNA-binding protein (MmcQ/YjbR family)
VPLTYREYNAFCGALPAATHVVQWGGSHVWKVGGKVFAIGGWERGHHPGITFKVSDIAWEILREAPGCRPAPYLASRGMKWIQSYDQPGLGKAELKQYLKASHALVAAGLSKKARKELGLPQSSNPS